MNFNFKRVADPVYKTIGLSELEINVVNTKAVQRLRYVKQLGLAHFVFPGADYSRFSHSLGVCHVTGRILEALGSSSAEVGIEDREITLYRLAGLLHDVGHYPFSHAMENSVKKFYRDKMVEENNGQSENADEDENTEDLERDKFFSHERVGEEVLAKDDELRAVLLQGNLDPEDISSVFMRSKPQRFANLVSSDLDADRIDYLLRTAHHSGLPYGSVDLDYIVSQMRIDNDDRVCITMKALRAADHMLLCRYFDYLQSTFHKTVTGAELVLEEVILALLDSGRISCSRHDVTQMIENGSWGQFDESLLIDKIRDYAEHTSEPIGKLQAQSILRRLPPKLVWEEEFLASRYEQKTKELFQHLVQRAKEKMSMWSERSGIEPERWFVWKKSVELTKVGSHLDVSSRFESETDDEDKYWQAIRVLATETNGKSTPIMEVGRSLMKVLSDYSIYILRVYVLLKPEEAHRKPEIKSIIQRSLSFGKD